MANVTEGVAFTFDPQSFLNGIDKIIAGIGDMNKKVEASADTISKKMTDSFGGLRKPVTKASGTVESFGKKGKGIVDTLILRVSALAIGFLSIRKAMSFIPEIGRTWQIVSNIFLRNFLWPLRKLLMPILQRILNWTRNNRKMFARWGQNLANVFRVIITMAKQVWNLLKAFWEGFSKTIKRSFGDITKSIQDIFNIFIFRLSVIGIYLGMVLKPVMKVLGKIAGMVVIAFEQMIEGAKEALPDLQLAFSGLKKEFTGLLKFFSAGKGDWKGFWKAFGKDAIMVLKDITNALTMLLKAYKIFSKGIAGIVNLIYKLQEKQGLGGVREKRLKDIMKYQKVSREKAIQLYAQEEYMKERAGERRKRTQDAIITKKGDIIETAPEDTIVAMKRFIPGKKEISSKKEININIAGAQITVQTTEKDAAETGRRVGEAFGQSLSQKIRNILLGEMALEGAEA